MNLTHRVCLYPPQIWNEIFPKIPRGQRSFFTHDKRELGIKLLDQLEYMEDLLSEYQKKIKAEGAIIEATNGNGFTVKTEHPASKAYAALIGKYNAMAKTVEDIILDSLQKSEGDELLEFLGGAKR